MAADSAVTTGDQKIFNTVNKLFALSKHEPVGVMVYSSAEIMGVPIETVIKGFRRDQGLYQSYQHLEEYCKAFEAYLGKTGHMFTDEARLFALSGLTSEFIQLVRSRTYRKLSDIQGWGHPTKDEAAAAISEVILGLESHINSSEELPVTAEVRNMLSGAISIGVKGGIEYLSNTLPVSKDIENRISKLAVEHLVRRVNIGSYTGVVIAGFGKSDIYPRLRSFEFYYDAFGIQKIDGRREHDISLQLIGQIAPFAQSDVMHTFVQGIDYRHLKFVESYIDGFIDHRNKIATTAPKVKKSKIDAQVAVIAEFKLKLLGEWNNLLRDKFIDPTMDIVASMPKEELAVLAEALVNLTALKRKASHDSESVGGPTDVAVITKGDGLVWIKRKHYFDIALNQDFVSRQHAKEGQ